MKKSCFVILMFLLTAGLVTQGFCQEKQAPGPAPKPDQAKPAKTQKAKSARSKGGVRFAGVVTDVDSSTKTISIKHRGKVVTFDATNPQLRGFRSLDDIRVGRYAAVSYTPQGIRISKATAGQAGPEEVRERPVSAKKDHRNRVRVKEKGASFADVDENKDGKITPVELSTVVKDVTMEQFKAYDTNGDGCLSESEYRAVKR